MIINKLELGGRMNEIHVEVMLQTFWYSVVSRFSLLNRSPFSSKRLVHFEMNVLNLAVFSKLC